MIVVTGAAGFIGSCVAAHLNTLGHDNLILVDNFFVGEKAENLKGLRYFMAMPRAHFLEWFDGQREMPIECVIHLGARTDTTEKDKQIFDQLNLNYSKSIFATCAARRIPLIYASSGATYGLGEEGYSDRVAPSALKPLNPYGDSKNDFDAWVLQQTVKPPFWAGLKFFNVYGPNEYHKGRMASVIWHTFRQIKATGKMKLFRSHREDYKNGEQSRDFVYVKDVAKVIAFLMEHEPTSGLYNLGTGQARTFYDLAANTFKAMNLTPDIDFIDTPEDIRDTYQYFTEADMSKLREAGYNEDFYSLEAGIQDYVQQYLMPNHYFANVQ